MKEGKNMQKTYIFGHKKPDSDSVMSAIGLSYLKNSLGENTEPRILGDINVFLIHYSISILQIPYKFIFYKQFLQAVAPRQPEPHQRIPPHSGSAPARAALCQRKRKMG